MADTNGVAKHAKNGKLVREKLSDLFPFCVRFRKGDLRYIRAAAKRDAVKPREVKLSVWIREVVLERVERVLTGSRLQSLPYETAHGDGTLKCLRFTPSDYARVKMAAEREGQRPSAWVRAIVMDRAGCVPMRHRRESVERLAGIR